MQQVRRAAPSIVLVAAICSLSARAECSLITLESRQRSTASIKAFGVEIASDDVIAIDSVAHANALDGGLASGSEARTAARTGASEIAANATFTQRASPTQHYTEVRGDSIYEIDIAALNSGSVFLDFTLPPGFVEIRSNAEFPPSHVNLRATIDAQITFCSPACLYSVFEPLVFFLFSDLSGDYHAHRLLNGAGSTNPALDVSSLIHSNVDVVDSQFGFVRTRTWSYGAFSGSIPLGNIGAGQTFSVHYRLVANVSGSGPDFETWAAAAINDPFFLSSDVLPQQDLFRFRFTPVTSTPEPVTTVTLALGLALLAALRRRSRGV